MQGSIENVPQEMRLYNQWVVWKYVNTGKPKLAKVPFNPLNYSPANVVDPKTWGSFHDAVSAIHNFDGLGFVLTANDPFCFIDFDANADKNIIDWQRTIYNDLNSFSEISPSGAGLHIICRATVPAAVKRPEIEIYCAERYMTITGNRFNAQPIRECNDYVNKLWAMVGGKVEKKVFEIDESTETANDSEIYHLAASATNGDKFVALWNGDINTYHGGDQSRADFALIDILAFYTKSRIQIARMFRLSALGKREKASRQDYVQRMISMAFDQTTPSIDLTAITQQAIEFAQNNKRQIEVAADVHEMHAERASDLSVTARMLDTQNVKLNPKLAEVFKLPPGLTGEIAKFIYQQSPKPVEQIATVGAIGLMAGLCGKAYNVNNTGLNIYLLLLAGTGRGKEAISAGIDRLISHIQMTMPTVVDFVGPSDFASGQGLLRYVSDHPTKSFVSVFGEYGIRLKTISSSKANPSELMLQRVMLDLFSKSGKSQTVSPTAYSDAERNTRPIYAPSFSLIGESAPDWFYNNINDDMIRSGLLPRFTIVEYLGKRPPTNKYFANVAPTGQLITGICTLATAASRLIQSNQVCDVLLDDEASNLSDELDRRCDTRINDEEFSNIAELWNRAHLKTLRLAAILAVGKNFFQPIIDRECWEWAETFVNHSTLNLEQKFIGGSVNTNNPSEEAQIAIITRAICKYYTTDLQTLLNYQVPRNLAERKIVPYNYLHKLVARNKHFLNDKIGGTNALRRAIATMIDRAELQEIPKSQALSELGYSGKCYIIRSTEILMGTKLED